MNRQNDIPREQLITILARAIISFSTELIHLLLDHKIIMDTFERMEIKFLTTLGQSMNFLSFFIPDPDICDT